MGFVTMDSISLQANRDGSVICHLWDQAMRSTIFLDILQLVLVEINFLCRKMKLKKRVPIVFLISLVFEMIG